VLINSSALFTLYESSLSSTSISQSERQRLLHAVEGIADQAYMYTKNCYEDAQKFKHEVFSPYLCYSLCQTAIVLYRLWRQTHDEQYQARFHTIVNILREFKKRWFIANKYMQVLVGLENGQSSVIVSSDMMV
jgi:hypothetical protein